MKREQALDAVRSLLITACNAVPTDDVDDVQLIGLRTAIRAAIDATRTAPDARIALTEESTTSIERIVTALRNGLSRRQAELAGKMKSAQTSLDLHERARLRDAADPNPDPDEDPDDADAEYLANLTADRDANGRLIKAVERARETVKTDPLSLILPLGTVVETLEREVGRYSSTPNPGHVGVVVGYAPESENVNLVSFVSTVTDNYDHAYGFDGDDDSPERPPTFPYAAAALKVVAKARFADGSENGTPGYVPTHTHGKPGTLLAGHDMVVEALGWLWRIQEIHGIPERTQMCSVGKPEVFAFLKPVQVETS